MSKSLFEIHTFDRRTKRTKTGVPKQIEELPDQEIQNLNPRFFKKDFTTHLQKMIKCLACTTMLESLPSWTQHIGGEKHRINVEAYNNDRSELCKSLKLNVEVERIQKMLNDDESRSSEDEENISYLEDPNSHVVSFEDLLNVDLNLPESACYESDIEYHQNQATPKKMKMNGWEGKDRVTFWNASASGLIGRNSSYSINLNQGPKGTVLYADSPADFFNIFISVPILNLLVKHTNSVILSQKEKCSHTKPTDMAEVKAFMGLILLIGTYHANRLSINDFWRADGTGIEIFRLTMSLDRFRFLMSCLQFEDLPDTKEVKDVLAPIRKIFTIFMENCILNYNPSELMVIDEMLIDFRGRCPFALSSSKSSKCGIKAHTLCDAKTYYVYNMELDEADKEDNSEQAIVTRLISEISGSERNITLGKSYASVPLIEALHQNHRLTAVGVLKKNKKEIPSQFLEAKNREVFDSKFGFKGNLTLVSYVSKSKEKKDNMILLSSKHHDNKLDEASGEEKVPEILTFYNSTQSGVDVAHSLMKKYTVSRNSNRWHLTIFYTLLDIACVNSYILYVHKPHNKLKRRQFITEISKLLVQDHQIHRLHCVTIQKSIRNDIARKLNVTTDSITPTNSMAASSNDKPKRCSYCPRSKDRKVKTKCNSCDKFVCKDHCKITILCALCEDNTN